MRREDYAGLALKEGLQELDERRESQRQTRSTEEEEWAIFVKQFPGIAKALIDNRISYRTGTGRE